MNKKYEAILFDLDGTLLPMDNDEFTKGYLKLLSKTLAPCGYSADTMIPAMWRGVEAMVRNDGSRRNSHAFWEVFASILGDGVYADIPRFDAFYDKEFHEAIALTQPTEKAAQAVSLARSKADKVVLATNPMFPFVAVRSRMKWAGLEPEMFDLITDYDNSGSCKPNPYYYTEIVQNLEVDPHNCLMIGNNASEDIEAAMKVGMDTFLVTDCLIAKGEIPECKRGSFDDMLEFLRNI